MTRSLPSKREASGKCDHEHAPNYCHKCGEAKYIKATSEIYSTPHESSPSVPGAEASKLSPASGSGEATKRPWRLAKIDGGVQIQRDHLKDISGIWRTDEQQANAALIVEAVNEREGLKAERDALKQAVSFGDQMVEEANSQLTSLRARVATLEEALYLSATRHHLDADEHRGVFELCDLKDCVEARAALEGGGK